MKKVLITGGSGFIGSALRKTLAQARTPVINLDLKIPDSTARTETTIVGDIRRADDIESILEQNPEIDTVVHLAAIVSVPECENHPAETAKTNIIGTQNIITALEGFNARHRRTPQNQALLLFASSAAVYGNQGQAGKALAEDTPSKPLSHYAEHKLAGETMLRASKLPWAALRLFNVYGLGQDPVSPYSGVITRFQDRLNQNQNLLLNAGGIQTRDFVSVHDVAAAFLVAASRPSAVARGKPPIFNVGTGQSVTIRALADLMRAVHPGTTSTDEIAPPRASDVLYSCADIRQIHALLGWSPRVKLKDGLAALHR